MYTVGLRTGGYDTADVDRFIEAGAKFYRSDRGGLITFHGPGQLVLYPIINLKDFNIGIRSYVHNLESIIIETCETYGIKAGTTENTGVWVQDRKIAAIGKTSYNHNILELHW